MPRREGNFTFLGYALVPAVDHESNGQANTKGIARIKAAAFGGA
jgi:hypothetical protein